MSLVNEIDDHNPVDELRDEIATIEPIVMNLFVGQTVRPSGISVASADETLDLVAMVELIGIGPGKMVNTAYSYLDTAAIRTGYIPLGNIVFQFVRGKGLYNYILVGEYSRKVA